MALEGFCELLCDLDPPPLNRGYIRQMKGEAYKEASHVLRPEELEFLSQWAVNPPGGCARAMSMMVSELELDPQLQVTYALTGCKSAMLVSECGGSSTQKAINGGWDCLSEK